MLIHSVLIGNVMHLSVTSGGQHHLISQPAQVTVQTTSNTHPVNTSSPATIANRLPQNASSQGMSPLKYEINRRSLSDLSILRHSFCIVVPSSVVSSPGVVKIVMRQSTGKDGGAVPTLAVAPSPRVVPHASSIQYPSTTPVRSTPVKHTAPLQIAQRTPGPATAHYTIAPLRNPSQPQPPRPILKVVQPSPATTDQPGERKYELY